MADVIFFEVPTPLGFSVRVTCSYWELIVTIKHPVMRGREMDIQNTLWTPDEIRQSHRIQPCISSIGWSALDAGFAP